MTSLLLLLLALAQQPGKPVHAPEPGAPPGDWAPLTGVPGLRFRWSLPMANSCSLEIADPAGSGPVRIQLSVWVYITRPVSMASSNDDSPMRIQPTRIPAREEERALAMQLLRMEFETRTIHNCYGIVRVGAINAGDHPVPTPAADTASPENSRR
jgi:hypothetical protein